MIEDIKKSEQSGIASIIKAELQKELAGEADLLVCDLGDIQHIWVVPRSEEPEIRNRTAYQIISVETNGPGRIRLNNNVYTDDYLVAARKVIIKYKSRN
jgi:hypothetical protein